MLQLSHCLRVETLLFRYFSQFLAMEFNTFNGNFCVTNGHLEKHISPSSLLTPHLHNPIFISNTYRLRMSWLTIFNDDTIRMTCDDMINDPSTFISNQILSRTLAWDKFLQVTMRYHSHWCLFTLTIIV